MHFSREMGAPAHSSAGKGCHRACVLKRQSIPVKKPAPSLSSWILRFHPQHERKKNRRKKTKQNKKTPLKLKSLRSINRGFEESTTYSPLTSNVTARACVFFSLAS